jgi:hypothetical protein
MSNLPNIVLLDKIDVSVAEKESLIFEIKGGVFDGIKYKILIKEDDEKKLEASWDFINPEVFHKACNGLISTIIQDDFTNKLDTALKEDMKIKVPASLDPKGE